MHEFGVLCQTLWQRRWTEQNIQMPLQGVIWMNSSNVTLGVSLHQSLATRSDGPPQLSTDTSSTMTVLYFKTRGKQAWESLFEMLGVFQWPLQPNALNTQCQLRRWKLWQQNVQSNLYLRQGLEKAISLKKTPLPQ